MREQGQSNDERRGSNFGDIAEQFWLEIRGECYTNAGDVKASQTSPNTPKVRRKLMSKY
jgi:hypothetical protein